MINQCTLNWATDVGTVAVNRFARALNDILPGDLQAVGSCQIVSGIISILGSSCFLLNDLSASKKVSVKDLEGKVTEMKGIYGQEKKNIVTKKKKCNYIAVVGLIFGIAQISVGAYQVFNGSHTLVGEELKNDWDICRDPHLNPYCQNKS